MKRRYHLLRIQKIFHLNIYKILGEKREDKCHKFVTCIHILISSVMSVHIEIESIEI